MRRLRAGEWLAAAGGVALVVALLLPWYAAPVAADGPDGVLSGYEALSVVDILLTPIALLAVSLAVAQVTRDSPALPVGLGVLTAVFGKLAVLLVLFRLIDAPADALENREGLWLAVAAALTITAGGWLSLAAEHVRGLPPGPEPELRATPAP